MYIRYKDQKERVFLFPKGKSIKDLKWVFREHFDEKRQKYYYANLESKKTSWTLPEWKEQEETLSKESKSEKKDINEQKKDNNEITKSKSEPRSTKKTETKTEIKTETKSEVFSSPKTEVNNLLKNDKRSNDKINKIQIDNAKKSDTNNVKNNKIENNVLKNEISKEANSKNDNIEQKIIEKVNIIERNEKNVDNLSHNSPKVQVNESLQLKKIIIPEKTSVSTSNTPSTPSTPSTPTTPTNSNQKVVHNLKSGKVSSPLITTTSKSPVVETTGTPEEFIPSNYVPKSRKSVTLSNSFFGNSSKKNTPQLERTNSFIQSNSQKQDSQTSPNEDLNYDEINWDIQVLPNWIQTRTDVEESLQMDVFSKLGMGFVHVFYTLKVNHFITQNLKVIKKDKTLAIVRDFVGVYALFLVEMGSSTKLSLRKKSSMIVTDSFSLMHQFQIKDVEIIKGIIKLEINFFEDTLSIAISSQNRDRLKEALIFSIQQNRRYTGVDRAMRKLAVCDLLNTYHIQSNLEKKSMKSLIEELINSDKLLTVNTTNNEAFRIFKLRLRNSEDRDNAIETLIKYFSEKKKSYHNAIILSQVAIELPSPTFKLSQEKTLSKIFKIYAKNEAYELKYNLKIQHEECIALYEAMSKWNGRGYLEEEDFSIFGSSFILNSEIKNNRKSRVVDNLSKLVEPGIYIGLFMIYKDEFLQDSKEFIPMWKLNYTRTDELPFNNYNDLIFEWLTTFGTNVFTFCKQLIYPFLNIPSIITFKKSFFESVNNISNELNFDSGIIHDRAIYLQSNTIIIPITRILYEKPQQLPQGYSWTNLHDIEHKVYERYCGIDPLYRMEKLDDSFEGIRWIKNVISSTHQINNTTINPGFYLAYLRAHLDSDQVLVLNNNRNMIPYEYMSANSPTTREWNYIRKFFTDRQKFLPNRLTVNADTPEKICKLFEQKFARAFFKLQRFVGFQITESNWYYISPISLDENENIKFCVFVDFAQNLELSNEEKSSFLWRNRKIFENMNNITFNPRIFSLWAEEKLKSETKESEFNVIDSSTDEIFSRRQIQNLPLSLKLEYEWSSIQWTQLILTWKHSYPKNSNLTEQIWNQFSTIKKLVILESQKKNCSWNNISSTIDQFNQNEISKLDISNPVEVKMNPIFDEELQIQEDEFWSNIETEHFTTTVDNLNQIVNINEIMREPSSVDVCKEITTQIIETALVIVIDKKEFEEVKSVLLDTIDIVELIYDMIDATILEESKKEVENILFMNRQLYKENLLHKYTNVISVMEGEPDEITNQLNSGEKIYFTYDHAIRSLVHSFKRTVDQGTKILQVINSTQESFEILQEVSKYDIVYESKNSFMKSLPSMPKIVPHLSDDINEITEILLDEFSGDHFVQYIDTYEKLEAILNLEERLNGKLTLKQDTNSAIQNSLQTPISIQQKFRDQESKLLSKSLNSKFKFSKSKFYNNQSIFDPYYSMNLSNKKKSKKTKNHSNEVIFEDDYQIIDHHDDENIKEEFENYQKIQKNRLSNSTVEISSHVKHSTTPKSSHKLKKSFSLKNTKVPSHKFIKNLNMMNEANSFAEEFINQKLTKMQKVQNLIDQERIQRFTNGSRIDY